MKTYPRLFSKLFRSPLMLHEPARAGFERALLARMDMVPYQEPDEDPEDAPYRPDCMKVLGNIALIRIHGVIDKCISDFDAMCYGGCDLDKIDAALVSIANDPSIERVVLDINSPGGSVSGVPETAARVAALTADKEVRAFVSVECCSAAYYIASQADRIEACPSALLGSIGVYLALLDESRALEMEGYRVELMKAGKFKAAGASFKPLTDEERAMFQADVDSIYAGFVSAVRNGRGTVGARMSEPVSDDVMQGQAFRGNEAFKAGLCDAISGRTLDEYVGSLLSPN